MQVTYTKLLTYLLNEKTERTRMTEENAAKLANEIDKDAHRRKMELILVILLGVIVVASLVLVIYDRMQVATTASEQGKWATTTLTAVLGFITGYISARRNPNETTPASSIGSDQPNVPANKPPVIGEVKIDGPDTVSKSTSVDYTATVAGNPTARVQWEIQPAGAGTITPDPTNANKANFAAPNSAIDIILVATRQDDPTKKGQKKVKVQ